MYRRTIKIRTLLILFSFITIGVEFGALYLLEQMLPAIIAACFSLLLFTHIILETSISHETCFYYCMLNIIMSGALFIFSAIYGRPSIFVEEYTLSLLLTVLNLLLPLVYCTLRNLYDRGPRYEGYKTFFRNTSILIILLLVMAGIYKFFINPWILKTNVRPDSGINFIPFYTVASNVEAIYYKTESFRILLSYIIKNILFFIPVGFYIQLVLIKLHFVPRFFVFISIPVVIELLQYITNRGHCDIDDILLAVIGAMIGVLIYKIINLIYQNKRELNFLEERSNYSWARRYFDM